MRMTARSFLDSNVLLYAYDARDPAKRAVAASLMERLSVERRGVVSTQVLGEFFHVATRKLGMPAQSARGRLAHFTSEFHVVGITADVVLEAARMAGIYRISLWDAQVMAVARIQQIPLVLSEDLQDGGVMDGVRIMNPFRTDLIS
jgi:predicted nucleic acid-binding protein